jgi:UPF0755 protein
MQNRKIFYALSIITFLALFYYFFLSAPADFPSQSIIKIEQGANLRSVSLLLKNEHIIRSRLIFEGFAILFGGEKHIIEADYYFKDKLPVFEVARRISRGEHHMAPIVVVVAEGFTTTEIALVCASKLPNFNKDKFIREAQGLEGKLFPDTYFFLNTDNEDSVISSMSQNFDKKMLPIKSDIDSSGKTQKEIITMASIIEGEAEGNTDRAFISGILWKRIKIGMPLQVDSAPETYKTKGLPKSPIGNPGLASIKAAIYPQSSPYLYYLHDKNGNIHYARTYAEHLQNERKYLK